MKLHGSSIPEELLAETIEAYRVHGSQRAAAAALGITQSTFSARVKRAAERGLLGTKAIPLPGYALKQITSTPKGDFIKQTKEHGEPFELPPGHVIKGVSSLVDAEGRTIQSWIKTRTDTTMPDVIEALKQVFEKHEGAAAIPPAPAQTDDKLLSVYPIADHHNGLLAWGPETGEDYDLAIGAERLRDSARRLVSQSPSSKHAVILNLGDWQHTDDTKNITPGHGNILDVDTRYFKIVTAGVQLMVDVIDLALAKHEFVEVRNIPGNHDPHASVALTVALSMFYRSSDRVKVNADPSDFYYRRFGRTLIGATHGHKLKPADMAMNMAVTQREDWGATDYHWFLFGHIHHETVKEIGDVRVESFQSLAARDAWTASHGYCSGNSLTSVTLHEDDGEIGRHRVNLVSPFRKRTP